MPMFRSGLVTDLHAIHTIEQEQFDLAYEFFVLRQLFELHGPDWTVAEFEGEVCGYVLTALDRTERACFMGFAVARRYCGRGYGRALLESALDHCRAVRADQVFVTVKPNNRTAYHLYQTVGFELDHHEQGYFGLAEPRDVLVHKLYH